MNKCDSCGDPIDNGAWRCPDCYMRYMNGLVDAGDAKVSQYRNENDRLRGKLQRADKKIKEKMGIIDELYGDINGLRCKDVSLDDAMRQARHYKGVYKTGAKIRRGLAATIIEKDKSIGELVDRINDECEKNEKNVESLNYLSKHAQDYARQLLANDVTMHELKKELRELRDKYEPKLVRCEGYAACRARTCPHWMPHKFNTLCDKTPTTCMDWNCIPWRGC